MKLNVYYHLEKKTKSFFNIYVPISQMLNKEFVERIFTEEVNEGLCKVSMCVYSKRQHQELQDYDPPDWYFECDGKLLWKENFPWLWEILLFEL